MTNHALASPLSRVSPVLPACVAAAAAVVAVVAVGAACGPASPALVMYDASFEPQLALALHDGGRDKPLRIDDAVRIGDDILVSGARVLGERCSTSASDFVPLPLQSCFDVAHGVVARVTRAGAVVWSIGVDGDESVSCEIEPIVRDDGVRVLGFCDEGAQLFGAGGSIDALVDADSGADLGPAPELSSFPLYSFSDVVGDGDIVGSFDASTTRGPLNDNGVIDPPRWRQEGALDFSSTAGVQVVGDDVLVAHGNGIDDGLRFAVLSLADGSERSARTDAASSVHAGGDGWWTRSPVFVDDRQDTLQRRDRNGELVEEMPMPTGAIMLSGTREELWLAQRDGGPTEPVVVELE